MGSHAERSLVVIALVWIWLCQVATKAWFLKDEELHGLQHQKIGSMIQG